MTTYYVKNGGDDGASGLSDALAWATLSKVQGFAFAAGDECLFKRGDTWRGALNFDHAGAGLHGSADNPIIFDAYSTGNKPKLLGSVDLSATGAWSDQTGNIWKTASTISTDVGNLIFNNEASCGVKELTQGACDAQGKFFWNTSTHYLYLYSVGNPGTFYSHIEAACGDNNGLIVAGSSLSYVTFRNLDIRYSGSHAFGFIAWQVASAVSHVLIDSCETHWCGGNYNGARQGDGVQIYTYCSDIEVKNSWFDQCYDVGVAYQLEGGGTGGNIYVHHNLITNCDAGFNVFGNGGTSTFDHIHGDQNTFVNIGAGWSHAQRPSQTEGTAFTYYWIGGTPTITNLTFRNNVVYGLVSQHAYVFTGNPTAGLTIDYNCYYPDGAAAFRWSDGDTKTFADWQTDSGQDAHSVLGDPALGAAYRLTAGSPALNVGTAISGIGQQVSGAAPDMGAFEYGFKLCPFKRG